MDNTLVLFDIDDTLTDSQKRGSQAFADTYKVLYNIDNVSIDWGDYPHVTDWGLSYAIFKRHFKRAPTRAELNRIEDHYNKQLLIMISQGRLNIKAIPGAVTFLEHLQQNHFSLGLATGGWSYSARLKLLEAGFSSHEYPLASSDVAWSRTSIMKHAISLSTSHYGKSFDRVIYFGDGVWDYHTCKHLDIPFIGIDHRGTERLKHLGQPYIFNNFDDVDQLIRVIHTI